MQIKPLYSQFLVEACVLGLQNATWGRQGWVLWKDKALACGWGFHPSIHPSIHSLSSYSGPRSVSWAPGTRTHVAVKPASRTPPFSSHSLFHASSCPRTPACPPLQLSAPEHLEPDRVLVPPLHVVDVPGHARHGVNGILHHLKAFLFLIKMFGDLLCRGQELRLKGPAPPSGPHVLGRSPRLPGAAGGT